MLRRLQKQHVGVYYRRNPSYLFFKATKRSGNHTRYCNWIGVKPVALNRALMCGEGGGLDGGVSGLVQGDLGPQAPPQMGLTPPISPCLRAPRESDGGSKVEQLRGWSHPLRIGGGGDSDVSAPG